MPPSTDHLKLIIQRFDAYIMASNTKAAFLLAFNTFICGGILTGYKTLISMVNQTHQCLLNILLLSIFIAGIICMFFVLRAMYPYTNSGNSSTDKYHTLIFFKSVSEFRTAEDYVKALKAQTDDELWEDLAKQIHAVGVGLKNKYQFIERATTTVYVELGLILLLVSVMIYDKI